MTGRSKEYIQAVDLVTGSVNICVGNQKLHHHQQFQQREGLGTAQSGATACRLVGVKMLIFVAVVVATKEVLLIHQEEK